jgi:predicted CopG family antitoxin
LQPAHEIDIVNVMTKLTTISVTTEQHEQLKEMANNDGIAMWELIDRFLRRERRRKIGQMLTETNANRTSEERLFEAAVAAAGGRSVRDALR